MTINSELRAKVIELHVQGKSRNQIAKILQLSQGSVSNILKANQAPTKVKPLEPPSQPPSPQSSGLEPETDSTLGVASKKIDSPALTGPVHQGAGLVKITTVNSNRVTTSPTEEKAKKIFKDSKDIEMKNHTITQTQAQSWEQDGHPVEDTQGQDNKGPLSWFVKTRNGYDSETDSEDSKATVNSGSDKDRSLLSKERPQSTFVKTIATHQQQKELVADIEDLLEPSDLSLDKVELESIPDSDNPDLEDPPIMLGIDWDSKVVKKPIEPVPEPEANRSFPELKSRPRSIAEEIDLDENYERRFWLRVMDEKRTLNDEKKRQEQERQKLNEEREEFEIEKHNLGQRENNLKARESKIAEVQLLIPLARQFQLLNVDIRNFLPWVDTVQNYAETHNTDLTTAAFDIKKNLEACGELEITKKEIKKAEAHWSTLANSIRQKEAAVQTVMKLQATGYTEGDMKKLIGIVKDGRGYRKLDTELQSVSNGAANNSNPAVPDKKLSPVGYGDGPSMNDNQLMKLRLLKSATMNVMNKMGGPR